MERERPSTSERTPLVQPAYVFESSLARRYQRRRLRSFQCCICVGLLAVLGVALLVSVSYTLDEENHADSNSTSEAGGGGVRAGAAGGRVSNLTLSSPLQHLLQLTWPRPDSAPGTWLGTMTPAAGAVAAAAARGSAALAARRRLEASGGGGALAADSPAARAQAASATAAAAALLADTAYAIEHATKALTDGSGSPASAGRGRGGGGGGGVGRGPRVAPPAPWPEPPYCAERPPPCARSRYRTADGACNNLRHPRRWGVAFTPFRRALPPDYADGVSAPRAGADGRPLPSARLVSVAVHRPRYPRDSAFTVMLAVWGQFLDHDITATALSKGANGSALSCCSAGSAPPPPGLEPHPECFPVQLASADPFYQNYNLTCMEFVRSAPAPSCFYGPREQLNQMSAFIDGSVVYGATEALSRRLRAHAGGRLRMLRVDGGTRDLLPQSTDPHDGCNTELMSSQGKYCFEAGDARANENLHLTTMHLVWARQHNRVARALQRHNPHWEDETLFQEARRILGAQMQHITYNEFLPIVLGSDVMSSLNMSGAYSHSYDPDVDPTVANHFAAAAFRFAHTLLPGLIHAVDADTGSAEYVHLHEMLFNPYSLYSPRGPERALYSALGTRVNRVDAHVTDELSNHLFERTEKINGTLRTRGPCGLDLVSLNIQRGRDHGLPAYPAWRRHCGLSRPERWADLEGLVDPHSLKRMQSIYASVEEVDVYTGALSEEPHGRLLGPTLTCLVADQFLRLRRGDRFWYENSDDLIAFTPDQLAEIRKTTLASVICDNADALPAAQARVMQSADADNPLRPCAELPRPDWTHWRQTPPQ